MARVNNAEIGYIKTRKENFYEREKILRTVRWKTASVTAFEFLPEKVCALLRKDVSESNMEFIFNPPYTIATLVYMLEETCNSNNSPRTRCFVKQGN